MEYESIRFSGKVLDNVHGFIEYTEAEDQIMHLLLFKRLQSIKQLSLVNWVFPGSEHTRFIHSLGVMHIADRIATHLGLSPQERKIVRLAGLLHDIGHYPLSHVCEFPYRNRMELHSSECFCKSVNTKVLGDIEKLLSSPSIDFMQAAKQGHHEEIGALVIRNSQEIIQIITNECGEDAVDIICDMITGNVERDVPNTPLLVQILHSELDADGIDYMLRDAVFSGTSFGSFEVDQLIGSMVSKDFNGKPILCISHKGIAAADQYLINKFFSFSQVIFNKHTSILEWMAEQIISWMQEFSIHFPKKDALRNKWISGDPEKKDYLSFNDNYFWSSLKSIIENPAKEVFPPYVRFLCEQLLKHQELEYIENSEYKIISNNKTLTKNSLLETEIVQNIHNWDDKIAVLSRREITKHRPYAKFIELIKLPDSLDGKIDDDEIEKHQTAMNTLRLMDGICVADEETPLHLLCDDRRSLMQHLCDSELVILRAYNFPV